MNKTVNFDLSNIVLWQRANKIPFNVNQRKIVVFRSPTKQIYKNLNLRLRGQKIEPKCCTKYLRDFNHEHLSFNEYMRTLKQKLNRPNGILAKLRYYPSKHSSWWRRLQDVFRLRLQKTSSRRLQDVLIKTNMFALALRLQKTSSRRLQDVLVKTNIVVLAIRLQDVFKRSCQDVFKMFSRRLQDVLQKRLQDVFKMSSRRFEDVFNTFSRHIQDVLPRRLQDIFTTSCKDIFKTFSRRIMKLNCSC